MGSPVEKQTNRNKICTISNNQESTGCPGKDVVEAHFWVFDFGRVFISPNCRTLKGAQIQETIVKPPH